MNWKAIEKAVVAACALVVVGLVGALVYLDAGHDKGGPKVTAKVLGVQDAEDGVAARYEVRNESDVPLVDVTVKATYATEEVEQVIPHLPAFSERRATAVFHVEAKGAKPEVRVLGYLEP